MERVTATPGNSNFTFTRNFCPEARVQQKSWSVSFDLFDARLLFLSAGLRSSDD